ncbi:hypothetical protein [Streptomyces sp. NPDC058084]|uniref:hypothetical protein n=1 Tax=Streptomyces sp. NPDC058084 TaxID=3346333 RepID=UPI0036F0CF72
MTDSKDLNALQIRRPSDIPFDTTLRWKADRATEHAMRLFDNALPADFPHPVERGTAQDAVAELALRESIRQDVENGQGTRLHTALELGATWAEVAAALDISPEDARALLRQWADGQHHLYLSEQERGIERPLGFTPDQHAAVVALTERSDDEVRTA